MRSPVHRCVVSVLVLLSVLVVGPAFARDIFVNNRDGDDRSLGHQAEHQPDGPVRTIARALQLAGSGDRIVLAKTDEPYRESISLVGSRHSGDHFRPFMVDGNGAILDGSAPIPPAAWQHYRGAVFRFRPPRMGYQQLFIDDRPAVRVLSSRLADAPPALEPLQWSFHAGHLYFCVNPDKLPQDYALTYAHQQTGITLYHVERVGIVNLTVQGFQVDGISAYNSARRVHLVGVTCRGNGRSGVSVGGASQLEIDDCLIGDNGRAQVLTLPFSVTTVHGSELLSNTAPAWVDLGGKFFREGQRGQGGLRQESL